MIFAAVLSTDRCYVEQHLTVILVVVCAWLVGFLLASGGTRLALLAIALAGAFFYGTVVHPPPHVIPAAEVGSILTMRHAAISVQGYKQHHLAEGYPEKVPAIVPNCRARGYYEFTYTRERSAASAIADRFTLVAVPLSRPDRGLRSFALTEDGHLYATKEHAGRPANRNDEMLY